MLTVPPPTNDPQRSVWMTLVRKTLLLDALRGCAPTANEMIDISVAVKTAWDVMPPAEYSEHWAWMRMQRDRMLRRWSRLQSRYFDPQWWAEFGELPSAELLADGSRKRREHRDSRRLKQGAMA